MRHRKQTFKLNRTVGHRRALIANMLKALVEHERIETTVTKAKELRRHADKMITLAKKDTLAARRQAIAEMMISFNALDSKQRRAAKEGDHSAYNGDRKVIHKLFGDLGKRYTERQGGYTRIIRKECRVGDGTQMCYIEYV
ncbi:MAG: 50S ribosomal protein L17 [Simkaniaceae bacterium]|nr:50S ribosomal protein L17 [Simkaniaceae bacterium]